MKKHKRNKIVVFQLTKSQRDLLKDLFDLCRKKADKGKPGMVLAQIHESGDIRVTFIQHKLGVKIIAIWDEFYGLS